MSPRIRSVKSKVSHLCRSIMAFTIVVGIVAKRKPSEIWIGDSHVHYLANSGAKLRRYSITPDNRLVIWIGPKLLYTVSTKGFKLDRLTKLLLLIARKNLNVFILLGEIDCRVHLVPKTMALGQVAFDSIAIDYKRETLKMVAKYKLANVTVLTPVPQSDFGLDNPAYPRRGTLADRILVTNLLTDSLLRLISDNFNVINLSTILSNQVGKLNPSLSDDGIHVNALGSRKVLNNIREVNRRTK